MIKHIAVAAILVSTSSFGADLTLNDLPAILQKLRGCTETKSFLSGTSQSCKIPSGDLWVSVNGDGKLTLFKQRSYGNTTYANGNSVNELLQDFAAKLNNNRNVEKEMLDNLGPFLATQ